MNANLKTIAANLAALSIFDPAGMQMVNGLPDLTDFETGGAVLQLLGGSGRLARDGAGWIVCHSAHNPHRGATIGEAAAKALIEIYA